MPERPSLGKRMSRQESDLMSLRTEREASKFPISKPPFIREDTLSSAEKEELIELEEGELMCKAPDEVPWIDLLLEISMTTAFSSLTDGTPILQWDNAVSYICFFTFVWWIWISQVAYNMRFRQADWLHRLWVLLQLLVFSALCAFTADFDITFGLSNDPTEALRQQLMIQLGNGNGRLAAETFRDNRLPRVNARGISMVLALSRLLLLVQYVVVYFHAKGLKRGSILVHMGTLVFSSMCYFGAFFVLGSSGQDDFTTPIPALEIAKLVLWFVPIVVEMISHFVALRLPGFVRYSTESVYARNATLFIIILGGGLDKITSGFSAFVGNIGLKINAVPLFLATATIFICLFSLYFSTPGSGRELSNRRALLWFMSQGLFLGPLLITLQAIAQSLIFSNLLNAVSIGLEALAPMFDHMRQYPDVNVTIEMFPDSQYLFDKIGAALPVVINDANRALAYQQKWNDSIVTYQLQEQMIIIYDSILAALDLQPDVGTLLWAQANIFLDASMTNATALNEKNYSEIWSGIILDRGSSELWFFPAAGAAVLALVVMSLIKGRPRDKWEWVIVINRSAFGIAICLLALLDIGGSNPLTAAGTTSGSKIWKLVLGPTQWPLVILALVLLTLRLVEHLIGLAAGREYMSFENIKLFQGPARSRTQRYQRPDARNRDSMALSRYRYSYTDNKTAEPLYSDPFDPYEELEDTRISRQTSQSQSDTVDGDDRTLHGDEHPLIPKANAPGDY
ncbi:hypothetical protein HWV62_22441 [Athelia sp. TMB]|nr:hypothetical protein HWV62_22441 [Athelia sp. TMB]